MSWFLKWVFHQRNIGERILNVCLYNTRLMLHFDWCIRAATDRESSAQPEPNFSSSNPNSNLSARLSSIWTRNQKHHVKTFNKIVIKTKMSLPTLTVTHSPPTLTVTHSPPTLSVVDSNIQSRKRYSALICMKQNLLTVSKADCRGGPFALFQHLRKSYHLLLLVCSYTIKILVRQRARLKSGIFLKPRPSSKSRSEKPESDWLLWYYFSFFSAEMNLVYDIAM